MNQENENNHLVVAIDDDLDLLEMIVFAFESKGISIKVFSSGTDAMKYFSEEGNVASTHLLIVDRLLPDMDGLDIIKQLSKKYPEKMPMVLILSVLSADKDILTGLESGAIDYLTKPFNLDVLIDKSQALLSRYK